MSGILKKAARKLALPFNQRRSVEIDGLHIPPAGMRLGGAHFQDDRAFVESGKADVRKLSEAFGIDQDSSVLDIGCGVGRLPIGLYAEFGSIARYTGVDVSRDSIEWCEKNVASRIPGTEFLLLDVRNERYNRSGKEADEDFSIPVEPGFDGIFLYSVFSHMEANDIKLYLQEFRRLVTPDGGVLLTAFVEDDVPDVSVNPDDYGPLDWDGPLHCVRFSSSFFGTCVRDARFEIVRTDHGTETDGQSAFYLAPV